MLLMFYGCVVVVFWGVVAFLFLVGCWFLCGYILGGGSISLGG